jgi:hypothetical protein
MFHLTHQYHLLGDTVQCGRIQKPRHEHLARVPGPLTLFARQPPSVQYAQAGSESYAHKIVQSPDAVCKGEIKYE